jgi:hypothetical protein
VSVFHRRDGLALALRAPSSACPVWFGRHGSLLIGGAAFAEAGFDSGRPSTHENSLKKQLLTRIVRSRHSHGAGRSAACSLTIALLCSCATAPPSSELPSAILHNRNRDTRGQARSCCSTTSTTPRPSSTSRESSTTTRTVTTRSWPSCRSETSTSIAKSTRKRRATTDFVGCANHSKVSYALPERLVLLQPDAFERPRPGSDPRGRRAVQALIDRYPNSEMAPDARTAARCEDRLASQDIEIGDYYFRGTPGMRRRAATAPR